MSLDNKISVLDDKGYVRLVSVMGNDLSVVNAARVSYDKESNEFSDGDGRLLKFLIKNGHTSPFRHAAMTFEVYAPLMVARQWWKYAVASSHIDDQNGWNESSRRYVTEEPEFYIPAEWRSIPENKKQGSGKPIDSELGEKWTLALESYIKIGEILYQKAMEEHGICAEQARLFLPSYGMYVRWRWTTSLQGVLHFLEQRLEHTAQKEITDYARAVEELTRPHFPATMEAWSSK